MEFISIFWIDCNALFFFSFEVECFGVVPSVLVESRWNDGNIVIFFKAKNSNKKDMEGTFQ